MDSFRRELMESYGEEVERWKLDLALSRIAQMGFPENQWRERLQDAVLAMMEVSYDPNDESGATEATLLYRVVTNRLIDVLRRQNRNKKPFVSLEAHIEQNGPMACPKAEQEELILDVRLTIADLPERHRRTCEALLRGESRAEIARRLRCGWHTVNRALPRIRVRLHALGLSEWIGA